MAESTPPEKLLAEIAAGSSEALATLYDDFSAALLGIALGILKNRAEAEEALQEIFLSVWKKASRYNEAQGRASTWLISITRNRCIDRLRMRQRREKVHRNAHDETTIWPEQDTPLIASERASKVQQTLKSLPDEMRHILELVFFQNLTQTEIAETLQQPLGTVKSRIRRAMERVRLALADQSDLQSPS